jgi:hypothetical protein
VPSSEFFFAVELSSQGASSKLLTELASCVLGHVGSSAEAMPDLVRALQQAVATGDGVGERRCDVQFRAQGGKLEVLVSSNGGRIWQTSHVIS